MLHLQEPLHTETRLNSSVRITFRIAHLVVIILYLLHQAGSLQIDRNLLAHLHAIHTDVHASCFADGCIRIEDVDGLQVVLLTQHVVVRIVCRSHLQATRTKFNIDIAVFNHRNYTAYQGDNHLFALQPLILRVFRVDTHGRITHDRFRTSGSNDSIPAAGRIAVNHLLFSTCLATHIIVCHVILQVVELALFIVVDHLLIAQSRLGFRIPVDHTQTAIDQSFVIQITEHLDHTGTPGFIHRESRTVPIAAGT